MLRLPLVRLLRSVAERAVEHLLLRVTHSRVHEHCSGRACPLRLQQRDVKGGGELAKDHSSSVCGPRALKVRRRGHDCVRKGRSDPRRSGAPSWRRHLVRRESALSDAVSLCKCEFLCHYAAAACLYETCAAGKEDVARRLLLGLLVGAVRK